MAQPNTPSTKGQMPGDELDKQVDDMLDALEQGVDALFDSVNATGDHPADESIVDAVADAENSMTADRPAPTPIEPGHAGAVPSDDAPEPAPLDEPVEQAMEQAAEALDDASPAPETAEADDASASFSGDPDDTGGGEAPDPGLDQAIAEAVAQAEGAIDDGAHDPPTESVDPIDAAAEDEHIAEAVDAPSASHGDSGTVEEARAEDPAPAPAEPEVKNPTTATAPSPEPAPEKQPAPAIEAKPSIWGRASAAASAAMRRAKPISIKAGSVAAHTVSRPLVMLEPAMRDYLGYAAAVTAFMGLCAWVLSLI